MKTITLDNCVYELTDERFEKLLASKAIINEDGEHYLNCWYAYTYKEVCMLIKGPD